MSKNINWIGLKRLVNQSPNFSSASCQPTNQPYKNSGAYGLLYYESQESHLSSSGPIGLLSSSVKISKPDLVSMFGGHDPGQGEWDDVGYERDADGVDEDQLQQTEVTHRDVGWRHPMEQQCLIKL